MSQRPGSTVIPSVEITSAPEGTASVPSCPTAEILSPSIRMTLFWIGGPAKPSTSVPPTSAFIFGGVRGDCAELVTPSAMSRAAAATRFMACRSVHVGANLVIQVVQLPADRLEPHAVVHVEGAVPFGLEGAHLRLDGRLVNAVHFVVFVGV